MFDYKHKRAYKSSKTSFIIKESKHRHYGYSMSTMSVFDDKKK